MFCTAKKGSIEESNWIHNMMPKGYTHGMALKNIRTRLEGLGYKSKVFEKNETAKEQTITKHFNFDYKTIEIMGGKCIGNKVEEAVNDYSKTNHTDTPTTARSKLPLGKAVKNVSLTMRKSVFDLVDKIADGNNCRSTIIEVAIWSKYAGK
jgi:hypothetical protein